MATSPWAHGNSMAKLPPLCTSISRVADFLGGGDFGPPGNPGPPGRPPRKPTCGGCMISYSSAGTVMWTSHTFVSPNTSAPGALFFFGRSCATEKPGASRASAVRTATDPFLILASLRVDPTGSCGESAAGQTKSLHINNTIAHHRGGAPAGFGSL